MRITSKGQVTIPIAIREEMDLLPETEVEFAIVDNVVVLRKARHEPSRGTRAVDRLLQTPYDGPSTEALMALTRGEV